MESTSQTDDVTNIEMKSDRDVINMQNIIRHEDDKGGNVKEKLDQFHILDSIDDSNYKFNDSNSSPYIECFVNGNDTIALVDTGYGCSTMSLDFAKRCGIAHLIDTSCVIEVIGLSTSRMTLGVVHVCPIKTTRNEFLTSVQIMQTLEDELILGMDILQRYKCTLDLSNKKLLIGATNSAESFLEVIETKEECTVLNKQFVFQSFMWIIPYFFGDPRLRYIEANMKAAETLGVEYEQMPSPYIDCKVNGHHVRALVDSGAEASFVSVQCAERCGIRKLAVPGMSSPLSSMGKCLDNEGTVQDYVVTVENNELLVSLDIHELSSDESYEDMVLGYDTMWRNECSIDLESNKLIIGNTQNRANLILLYICPEQENTDLR